MSKARCRERKGSIARCFVHTYHILMILLFLTSSLAVRSAGELVFCLFAGMLLTKYTSGFYVGKFPT